MTFTLIIGCEQWLIAGIRHYSWACTGKGQLPLTTKIILSHHDYERTPDSAALERLLDDMFKSGADIAKVATTAQHIEDAARVLALPKTASSKPMLSCLLSGLERACGNIATE